MFHRFCKLLAAALLTVLLSSCTILSTGARSAYVVWVQNGASYPMSRAELMDSHDRVKALLADQFLWRVEDRRGAKWVAVVEVGPPAAERPMTLSLDRVGRNEAWNPQAVSDPWPLREDSVHPALRLAEQNQQNEQWRQGR